VQRVDPEGIAAVAAIVDVLAEVEALPWHAASVRLRMGR
jgi:histidinol dehydrogenase